MGAGMDPDAPGNLRDDNSVPFRKCRGAARGGWGHSSYHDRTAGSKDVKRACRAIRGSRRSEVLEHVKKQTGLLTRLRWGHSLHKVARDAMEETRRGESRRLVRNTASQATARDLQEGLSMPRAIEGRRVDPASPMSNYGSKHATGNHKGGSGDEVQGNSGRDQLLSAQPQTYIDLDTNNLGQYPPTQGLRDSAATKRKDSSAEPAQGVVGDTTADSTDRQVSTGAAGPAAVATAALNGKAVGQTTAEAAGAAGGRLVRKGRSMGDRVARLGLALDDAETRADRTGGKASKGLRARSGQRLNLPCAKRHIKIIRSMTLGDAGAAAGNVTPGGGVIGAYASVGAGSTGPNGLNTKTNGLRGPSGVGGKSAGAARALPASQSAGGSATAAAAAAGHPDLRVTVDSATLVPAAAAAATATSATAAGATPVEGAVSLKTIGKTVAFLAKFAAPANEGRDADGGAFGGGGKIAGGGGGRSSYGLRQSWYSAAAAKAISEEAPEEGGDLEDEGEAALALERLLHAPPALQFVSESRRGGFNKGSTITYGSTITLQAFHGGILCFNGKGKAQASALGAQPNALLTVWNLQDLQSKGPVRYGDVLFLQMGRHEVMGSSLIMHKDPKQKEGAQSSAGAGSALSVGTSGEQETEEACKEQGLWERRQQKP